MAKKEYVKICLSCGGAFARAHDRYSFCSLRCTNERFKKTPDQFWAKVNKVADGCWEWTGYRTDFGYGHLRFDGKILAHRLAWILTHGPIPDGVFVLHHCDNPPCCNPAHLFLGTKADNNADKIAKGRQAKGEATKSAVLTEQQAMEIKSAVIRRGRPNGDGRQTINSLAEKFGVSRSAIRSIRIGRTWAHAGCVLS